MFSNRFEHLISKHPNAADPLRNIAGFFSDLELRGTEPRKIRLDPGLLHAISKADNYTTLSYVICVLVAEKILDRVLIVENPYGAGVAEYSSIEDIPVVVHDPMRDLDLEVTTDNIKPIYKVHFEHDAR